METSILKTAGQIAGIGGISLGVLLIVLRGIIRKRIFPKFKSEKLAYRLLRLIIIVVWTVAIAGIAAWVFTTVSAQNSAATIAISNTEFSGDMHIANTEFILNQYQEIHGKPLEDKMLRNEIERGMNLIKGGVYEDAIPILKEIAEKIDLPAVYNNMGVLYTNSKDYGKAREAYIKAIEKGPEYQPVQLNLGLLLERQGKGDEALKHFAKAPNLRRSRRSRQQQLARLTKLSQGHEAIIETNLVEIEPNNEWINSNVLPLNKWVLAELESDYDTDHFKITAPQKYRDIIKIELHNLTKEFKPFMGIFDKNKHLLNEKDSRASYNTPGQDLEYYFSAEPGMAYYFRIFGKEHYAGDLFYYSHGAYRLKVTPMKAYDVYEPNNNMLQAKDISLGKPIDANIMDSADMDCYHIKTSSKKVSVIVSLENQSTTLGPYIHIHLENKQFSQQTKGRITPGQNLEYSFSAGPGMVYYIIIGGVEESHGAYRLTVSEKIAAVTSG
jgi:tetratricopeptide (TPR) repeat protein